MSKELEVTVPDQIPEPDWDEVKSWAAEAAKFTMQGDISKAQDYYQHIAIEVMSTLYGPNAIATFIEYAMQNEKPQRIIQLG